MTTDDKMTNDAIKALLKKVEEMEVRLAKAEINASSASATGNRIGARGLSKLAPSRTID